ncbi:lysophospholipid acyltransferase family protein [Noviherbaspirillum massiliense]|uniref:lysophospholipid acyltransferase family protein n=1 Tax=Noviherbaspirillum massiliense TaxID=1465823 RepID=UPI0002D3A41C|nr:lysophospholipid acyltransferase family protein [Noviherbaspirillum massiliense]
MKEIRTISAWSYGCYAWLLFILVLLIFGSLIMLVRTPRHARPVARTGTRLLFRFAALPLAIHDKERLPRTPHILLVNHTSFLDGLVLTALLPAQPGYAFVVRQQHAAQRVLCPLLRALGTVVLGRPHLHAAINTRRLRKALRRGKNLIVFPEGGIAPDAGLKAFHSGAFVAAVAENVPVVVAGLRGSRRALRLGTWLTRRIPITLEIGAVLTPDVKGMEPELNLSKAAHEAMLPLTGEEDFGE